MVGNAGPSEHGGGREDILEYAADKSIMAAFPTYGKSPCCRRQLLDAPVARYLSRLRVKGDILDCLGPIPGLATDSGSGKRFRVWQSPLCPQPPPSRDPQIVARLLVTLLQIKSNDKRFRQPQRQRRQRLADGHDVRPGF